MVDLNSTIFIQMIGFLLLLIILNVILYKPILSIIENRKKKIQGFIDESELLRSQSALKEKEYNEKLSEAEFKAKKEYNESLINAMKEKDAKIAEENLKTRKIIDSYKKEVASALDKESESSKKYSLEISDAIYTQVVGERG